MIYIYIYLYRYCYINYKSVLKIYDELKNPKPPQPLPTSFLSAALGRRSRRFLPLCSLALQPLDVAVAPCFFSVALLRSPRTTPAWSSPSDMKVKVISRSTEEFTRERCQDLQVLCCPLALSICFPFWSNQSAIGFVTECSLGSCWRCQILIFRCPHDLWWSWFVCWWLLFWSRAVCFGLPCLHNSMIIMHNFWLYCWVISHLLCQ